MTTENNRGQLNSLHSRPQRGLVISGRSPGLRVMQLALVYSPSHAD
jgi:hypothetical protein